MRFLLFKAVPSENLEELGADPEPLKNCHAHAHRLVRQDSQLLSFRMEFLQSLTHSGIQHRIVEHVVAVVAKKELQTGRNVGFRGTLAQGTAYQYGRAVADIRVDGVVFHSRHAQVRASRVHSMRQVKFGIYESSVKIKNEKVQFRLPTPNVAQPLDEPDLRTRTDSGSGKDGLDFAVRDNET